MEAPPHKIYDVIGTIHVNVQKRVQQNRRKTGHIKLSLRQRLRLATEWPKGTVILSIVFEYFLIKMLLYSGSKLTGSTKNNDDDANNNGCCCLQKKNFFLKSNVLWSAQPVKEKK